MKVLSRKKQRLLQLLAGAAAACLAVWLMVPPYRGDLRDYRAAMQICDRNGNELRVVLGEDDVLSYPVKLDKTGDWVASALVAAEDRRFYTHRGVDPAAVCRAALSNLSCRRVVSGASTLTMLVGKLTEPRPRNLWTKIVEACHAVRLEGMLTKDQILEQYLNRAPFGGNAIGIEAASQRYFSKAAADLSLPEAALLVGLPQSPSRFRPDRHPDRAVKRRSYVLERMKLCGFITEDQRRLADSRELVLAGREPQFRAPHFCDYVSRTYLRRERLVTSLDLNVQASAESALRAKLKELSAQGVRGGSVVVLDVVSGKVRAMVGAPDFWSSADSGQFNCALARRSPGSALKPFIYAQAFEQGLCSPRTVIADVPKAFAGYVPENFDGEYHGPVTVRDALVQSLNIPALVMVGRLGLENIVQSLRKEGFSTLDKPAESYGLSIALGTCEVTLLDLVNAYACLARKGVYSRASCLEDEEPAVQERVFSEEAAYMVNDILSGEERAMDSEGHIADVRLPRMAWKTGTSSGSRDAWCIAYNPEYVVGVWIGNPDGAASKALVGCSAAAPVACGILRGLYPSGVGPWFERPSGLKSRPVCSVSGCVPNASCTASVMEDYIPGITDPAACSVHCVSADGTSVEAWPAGLLPFVGSGCESSKAPNPAAGGRNGGAGPRIISPEDSATLHLLEDVPYLNQAVSLRATHSDSGEVYWFVDGSFFCKADSSCGVSWTPQRGRHSIVCSDQAGRSASVAITVE